MQLSTKQIKVMVKELTGDNFKHDYVKGDMVLFEAEKYRTYYGSYLCETRVVRGVDDTGRPIVYMSGEYQAIDLEVIVDTGKKLKRLDNQYRIH